MDPPKHHTDEYEIAWAGPHRSHCNCFRMFLKRYDFIRSYQCYFSTCSAAAGATIQSLGFWVDFLTWVDFPSIKHTSVVLLLRKPPFIRKPPLFVPKKKQGGAFLLIRKSSAEGRFFWTFFLHFATETHHFQLKNVFPQLQIAKKIRLRRAINWNHHWNHRKRWNYMSFWPAAGENFSKQHFFTLFWNVQKWGF